MKILPPKLVSVTQMVEQMTAEEAIVYMARVSSPTNQDNHDTAFKLIKYLVENGHWSPFDMVSMTLEVYLERATMAQLERHWSFRFQEFSQRYSALDLTDWSHIEGRRKADGGNRQGSGEADSELTHQIKQNCIASEAVYQDLLKQGCSPETARMAMPLATITRAYVCGSVRTWMTYFWQRASLHHTHAQKEHRKLADGCFDIFKGVFPNIGKLIADGMPHYILKEEWEMLKDIRKELLRQEVGF